MTDTVESSPDTEVGHVLMLDLCSFSGESVVRQCALSDELRQTVAGTWEYQRAESRGEVSLMDVPGGMAVVFSGDRLAPVQCAVEVAWSLQKHDGLKLRMGIGSGAIQRAIGKYGHEETTGPGVDSARNVMECGDPGHILLSDVCAGEVAKIESWAACINDIGTCELEPGRSIRVSNLTQTGIGNPNIPKRVQRAEPIALSFDDGEAAVVVAAQSPAAGSKTIAILYRRVSPADEYLMQTIEHGLSDRGYSVVIDRRLPVGIEWAESIERHIRGADAVVVLISEFAQYSEMLEYEVCAAYDAFQAQAGKPSIHPVRVDYDGPLREPFGSILEPFHQIMWHDSTDDLSVIAELDRAIKSPEPPASKPRPVGFQTGGGALGLDSAYYIKRQTDKEFNDALTRQDSIVLVKGARQMGKTSLLARGLHNAREAGMRVVLTDLQTLNFSHMNTPEELYMSLMDSIADQLDLGLLPDLMWNPGRGANMNLERFIRREVLGALEEPLVWGLDEVDRLFTCPFGSEVFGLFRSWHNRRSLDPAGPWHRFTLAISYATEAHLFITDLNQSPFNVGTRLSLDDFTEDQVGELNRRYGSPLHNPAEIGRFYALVNGQPYLVNRGLAEMANGLPVEALERQADQDEGVFGDHLRRILVSLTQDKDMLEVARTVLKGRALPNLETFYRLRSGGLIAGDSLVDARLRCKLYEAYLQRHLG